MNTHLQEVEEANYRDQRWAMTLSLVTGFMMLLVKVGSFWITGSAAILSDAAESVVHVGAVAFAAFSLRLSFFPPDKEHPYGHERIAFFSSGVEGGLIVAASLFIFYEAIPELFNPKPLFRLTWGAIGVAVAGAINGFLGLYLIRQGKKHKSIILKADGEHVLTDTWTSIAVVGGLILVAWTGWRRLDPILAILVATNILATGWRLVRESTAGLMDQIDPEKDSKIREILLNAEREGHCRFHELRHRNTGRTSWVEVHLLFPGEVSLREAHRTATRIEHQISSALEEEVILTTHLEPAEGHHREHQIRPPQECV